MGRDAEQQIDHPRQIREGGKNMKDILLPAFMVFLSGCLFGLFTAMIVDWYYEKKKKEVEDDGE